MNPVFNLEPVKVVKDRGDVILAAGGGEHMGTRVLDLLKFIEEFTAAEKDREGRGTHDRLGSVQEQDCTEGRGGR